MAILPKGACHADRAALLSEVAWAAQDWRRLHTRPFDSGKDWQRRMQEAEAALVRASARLAQIPDCSE
jgi:hypothetical protein